VRPGPRRSTPAGVLPLALALYLALGLLGGCAKNGRIGELRSFEAALVVAPDGLPEGLDSSAQAGQVHLVRGRAPASALAEVDCTVLVELGPHAHKVKPLGALLARVAQQPSPDAQLTGTARLDDPPATIALGMAVSPPSGAEHRLLGAHRLPRRLRRDPAYSAARASMRASRPGSSFRSNQYPLSQGRSRLTSAGFLRGSSST
jgi:hypothetical protein